MKIRRVNKKTVPNGTSKGVEIFQDEDTDLIYYKDVNGVLTPLTSLTSVEAAIAANTAAIASSGGYDNYIEVEISSAEILDIGSTPVELLPAPGDGLY